MKQILKQQFEIENKDYGTFLNRLHLGNSQIKLYYFDPEVLSKYFNHPERYHISDNIIGGYILTKDEYYFSLPNDKRDENIFAQIRYGKRKLVSSSIAIAVILHDLSELPLNEQKYWESYEIDKPIFSNVDHDFEKYIRQNFEAKFVDYEDPLTKVIEKIESINQLFNDKKLFRNVENYYLKSPVINTEKSYHESHKELYKLIGPDSLNKDLIKDILLKNLEKKDDDLIHRKSQREKGTNELFKMIFEDIGIENRELIKNAWNNVKISRVESSHKITLPTIQEKDYIQQFREDCEILLKAFEIIEKELSKIF